MPAMWSVHTRTKSDSATEHANPRSQRLCRVCSSSTCSWTPSLILNSIISNFSHIKGPRATWEISTQCTNNIINDIIKTSLFVKPGFPLGMCRDISVLLNYFNSSIYMQEEHQLPHLCSPEFFRMFAQHSLANELWAKVPGLPCFPTTWGNAAWHLQSNQNIPLVSYAEKEQAVCNTHTWAKPHKWGNCSSEKVQATGQRAALSDRSL